MAVNKLEVRVLPPQLVPQLINAKIAALDLDVMKQNDGAVGKLWLPSVKVVFDVLIEMTPINVQ